MISLNPTIPKQEVMQTLTRDISFQRNQNTEGIQTQVNNHLDYKRRTARGQQISAKTAADILAYVNRFSVMNRLQRPSYTSRESYETVGEIQKALLLTSPAEKLTIPILAADITCHCEPGIRENVLLGVLVCSPAHLYTLQQFVTSTTMTDKGLLTVHMDESMNIVRGPFHILTCGGTDIDFRPGKTKATRSFRPFCHMITHCLAAGVSAAVLSALKRVVWAAFKRELCIHRFIFDYSAALRKGARHVFPEAQIANCYPHIIGKIDQWKGTKFESKNQNDILSHISMLHECTSMAQFVMMFQLVMSAWVAIEEEVFANFFKEWYGPDSPCQGLWFILMSGVVSVLPSNNPLEGYFSCIKGDIPQQRMAVCQLNAPFQQFLETEIPKLLEYDFNYRWYRCWEKLCTKCVETTRKYSAWVYCVDESGNRPTPYQCFGNFRQFAYHARLCYYKGENSPVQVCPGGHPHSSRRG
jgi:hypothetical protein